MAPWQVLFIELGSLPSFVFIYYLLNMYKGEGFGHTPKSKTQKNQKPWKLAVLENFSAAAELLLGF